jgi:competence protein ComEA
VERSSWQRFIEDEIRPRVFTRRTAQLLLTSAFAVAAILIALWLFAPPPNRVEDGLDDASSAATQSPTISPTFAFDEQAMLAVHVAGEVVSSGVHELPAGSRVIDAITAAEGPTSSAELDALNLAAFVADGDRIYVPSEQDVERDPLLVLEQDVGASININRASASELEALPGVGPATADQIVRDRAANGPFNSVDDLTRVSGIGPATVEKLRDLASV